jgi:hypothetical protein
MAFFRLHRNTADVGLGTLRLKVKWKVSKNLSWSTVNMKLIHVICTRIKKRASHTFKNPRPTEPTHDRAVSFFKKSLAFFCCKEKANRAASLSGLMATSITKGGTQKLTQIFKIVETYISSHAKISQGFMKNRLKITSETKEWQKIILKP